MGAVKVMLAERNLPDREKHNSRLFVDLCENIHIHYREYRLLFSLPEYYEFVDIVNRSTDDVRNYLAQNSDYEEGRYKTTLMVAGGKARQMKFLENSPEPHRSHYFNNDLTIELQEEYITDEIHVHYRDLRLAMNRECFKALADSFTEARKKLDQFEQSNQYDRKYHPDRAIPNWEQDPAIKACDTPLMGRKRVSVNKIASHWHKNMLTDWQPEVAAIDILKQRIQQGGDITPIVLTREENGRHLIIDGHHRVRAYLELGLDKIPAIITDLTWQQSEPIRQAESLLKTFDHGTDYQYNLSVFFKNFIAQRTNQYYRDHFHRLITPPGRMFRALRGVKRLITQLPMPSVLRNSINNTAAWISSKV